LSYANAVNPLQPETVSNLNKEDKQMTAEDLRKEFGDKIIPAKGIMNDAYYSDYEIWLEQKLLPQSTPQMTRGQIKEYVNDQYPLLNEFQKIIQVEALIEFQSHLLSRNQRMNKPFNR
jgi:hypothetical protein